MMATPKYNTAYTTEIALISQTTGLFQANPTLEAGDVKVSIDGGDFQNVENLPSLVITGSTTILSLTLSATEMLAGRVVVKFSDQTGAEWRDAYLPIDINRYLVTDVISGGDIVNSNVYSIAGSATAATNLKQVSLGVVNGTVQTSGSNTSSTFKTNLSASDDFYGDTSNGGSVLLFTSGTLAGQSKRISGFVSSTAFITVESQFTGTPSNGDNFSIIGHIEI